MAKKQDRGFRSMEGRPKKDSGIVESCEGVCISEAIMERVVGALWGIYALGICWDHGEVYPKREGCPMCVPEGGK